MKERALAADTANHLVGYNYKCFHIWYPSFWYSLSCWDLAHTVFDFSFLRHWHLGRKSFNAFKGRRPFDSICYNQQGKEERSTACLKYGVCQVSRKSNQFSTFFGFLALSGVTPICCCFVSKLLFMWHVGTNLFGREEQGICPVFLSWVQNY